MKKLNLLFSLALLTSLVACGNNSSSSNSSSSTGESTSSSSTSSSSSSTSSSSSSTSSSSSSTSSSSSSSSNPVEEGILKDLKNGFRVRSTFVKTYGSGNPSITLIETAVGSGVAQWKQFSGSSWDSVTETTAPSKKYQYENDAEGNAKSVSFDTAGNPIYEPFLLKDSFTGSNVEAFWAETHLDNAFALFSNEDFVQQNDGTFALDLSEERLAESNYATAVTSLARQMYMVVDGSEYSGYYFIKQALTSYVLTVDGNGTPVSYTATFEDEVSDDGLGGTITNTRSISGEFIELGTGQVEKLVALEEKYPELDKALADLKIHNYEFSIIRNELGDGWFTSDSTTTIGGKSDGQGNFQVDYAIDDGWSPKEEHFGYNQIDSTHYRKYEVGETTNLWSGEAVEGSALSLLPSFPFSSAVFEKDEEASTEETTVYNFVKPDFLNSNFTTDSGIVDVGLDSITGWSLNEFSISLSENTVKFSNVVNTSRNMEAVFSNIGGVETINATVGEFKDLVAGNYAAKNTVKGTEIEFGVSISNDGVVAITKDGERFGSYGYTIDSNNQLVLDSAIESNTFTITEVTGEGEEQTSTNYICNVNKTLKVDDPFNPAVVNLELKVCEEGKTFGSTTKFAATRVVEETPVYRFEFTMPENYDPVPVDPNLYYWGKDASGNEVRNTISWSADGTSNMTLKDGTTDTYYFEIDASINLTGVIIGFSQGTEYKQSMDIVEKLPTEAGVYVITMGSWFEKETDKWVFEAAISPEVQPTYMKDAEDSYVVTIYYDLSDYLLGEKADYIPYISGIENCVDIIWTDENPEGYQYLIADAPEGYLDNFTSALVSVYGYTKVSDTVYTNETVGLSIELKEDTGYQQFFFTAL